MIIVVEPEGDGPEFILFNPNEDKLPKLIDSQKNKEKMSAQHQMYKSILERIQEEHMLEAKAEAEKEALKF